MAAQVRMRPFPMTVTYPFHTRAGLPFFRRLVVRSCGKDDLNTMEQVESVECTESTTT